MLKIRNARIEDAQALLDIYAPYVENTAISFEIEVPTLEDFRERVRKYSEHWMYVVAEEDGVILGYAYAAPFHPRKALEHCVEMSVYLKEDARGRGIGQKLYEHLEHELPAMGIRNLYVSIAWTAEEDEYLTNASERFHQRMGYKKVAHFHECGFKFGRYYDLIWMEKAPI